MYHLTCFCSKEDESKRGSLMALLRRRGSLPSQLILDPALHWVAVPGSGLAEPRRTEPFYALVKAEYVQIHSLFDVSDGYINLNLTQSIIDTYHYLRF